MWENLRMYAPAAQVHGDRIPISIYLLYQVQACSKFLREFFVKRKWDRSILMNQPSLLTSLRILIKDMIFDILID